MMVAYEIFKLARQNLGLTQADLASSAGISLPSIQNLEAGRANPSIETLEKLSNILGIEIEFRNRAIDWNLLSTYGVPITAEHAMNPFERNKKKFEILLKRACIELIQNKNQLDFERKQEALAATLLAIKSHYPTFYKKIRKGSDCVDTFMSAVLINGRIIKLKRIALASLSEYL